MDESCNNCRYSDSFAMIGDELIGCRRHAPVPLSLTDLAEAKLMDENNGGYYVAAVFPHVSIHDWCGDFEPNKSPSKIEPMPTETL